MPTELIVIFLLFFAVLAFGWFYFQRAKGRAEPTVTTSEQAGGANAPEPAATDERPAS